MKEILFGIVLISALTLALSPFSPWWGFAAIAFLISLILNKSGLRSFYMGFLGVGIVWLINMIFINIANDGILLTRIAKLFPTPNGLTLIFLTTVLGGLVGGLAAATGAVSRQLFSKK